MSEVISKTRFDIYGYLKGFILSTGMEQDLFDVPQPETIVENLEINGSDHPRFVNEFWTSRQRQACPLHEVAYRACFKPQLPRFFIKILTRPNDIVYDPFGGRGTTVLEAGILGRNVISNDVNPLSEILSYPRFFVPDLREVEERLKRISIDRNAKADIDLSMFYHSGTEVELMSLRNYLLEKRQTGSEDNLDAWIRMVATNRLTGHSPGFFSVYTLPPNQAVSPENQMRINQRRRQSAEYRDVHKLILRKTKSLTNGISRETVERLKRSGENAIFLSKDSRNTSEIEPDSVQLTVTSPPFLNVVQYDKDNWLRCWFNGINAEEVSGKITMCRSLEDWTAVMKEVFVELYRITRPRGWVAFEVGEIRNGKINLDEYVVPLGLKAGFRCEGIMVNQQEFTKTANIWGVNNNQKGTNSNRIVLFHKDENG